MTEVFFDSNVLLYLVSPEPLKARVADDLIRSGGSISVQVLNEFCLAGKRRFKLPWEAIDEVLLAVRQVCKVHDVTVEVHDNAVRIAKRYRFAFYDCVIVSSALLAGCRTLYSEDMQDGQVIDDQLVIRNPFRSPGRVMQPEAAYSTQP